MSGKLARIPSEPPHDLQAEQAILGAALLGGAPVVERLATDHGLHPGHFYRASHGAIFDAMLGLARDGDGIDPLTVRARLKRDGRDADDVEQLAGSVPDLGNARSYAAVVIEHARWRRRINAGLGILEAAAELSEERFAEAERELAADEPGEQEVSPEHAAERFFDWLGDTSSRVIETPFVRLNELLRGGLRPGATTVVGGWTSMGKSVVIDQLLEHARLQGLSACAYINEMSEEERVSRVLAGRTGVPFDKILGRDMTPRQWKRVVDELPSLPFAVQPCAGWDAERIARHVRRHRWGVFAVDHATLVPASTTAEWTEVSRQLTLAARQSGAHGLICVQFNHERDKGGARPDPVLRDLKWTGAWADDASNVMFVHRADEQVQEGIWEPGPDGYLRLAKVRNGRLGLQPVSLDPYRMRLVDPADFRAPREEQAA